MNRPIQAGDLCEVINAMGRGKSPNLGLVVTVLSNQGEHSQHGRIWRCTHPKLQQLGDAGQYITTGWADFAQSWLRRIDIPSMEDQIRDEHATGLDA